LGGGKREEKNGMFERWGFRVWRANEFLGTGGFFMLWRMDRKRWQEATDSG